MASSNYGLMSRYISFSDVTFSMPSCLSSHLLQFNNLKRFLLYVALFMMYQVIIFQFLGALIGLIYLRTPFGSNVDRTQVIGLLSGQIFLIVCTTFIATLSVLNVSKWIFNYII